MPMMRMTGIGWIAGGLFATLAIGASAADARTRDAPSLDVIVVTATRIPERVGRVPASISVVSGRELVVRDATDMASAMSLVPGVEAPPGGDAGPSSAVPSFWGLHEFDAFLLVVDGVPWGGAFNPGITTLDFNDVQRVEILKGSAPVLYGATSFVGVVQAIHYPAGQAAKQADLAFGSHGSIRGAASFVLPQVGTLRQSLAIDGASLGFSDPRESVASKHILYRGAADVGAGTLRIDANITAVRDVPPSPVLRVGTGLTAATPIDANFNPADARVDENKYQLAIGYVLPTAWGRWSTLASFAYSDITDIRAFLHPDLSGTADTQNQRRHIDDDYFDTHLAHRLARDATLIVGADLLYGHGWQTTLNGNSAYTVPLDGSVLPPATSPAAVNEIGTVNDRRWFSGAYAQFDWKPNDRWDLSGGVRLNDAYEHKDSSDRLLAPPDFSAVSVGKTMIRPTETFGASYRAWRRRNDEFIVYADYRNAFKPSALDFGPDYTPNLLSPETAQSYEAGVKGAAADGQLSYQADLFLLNFHNLVVATSSGALANAAGERLEGIELQGRYGFAANWTFVANAAYHDARFTHYLYFDGVANVDVGGRQLTLAPHLLASAGLLYTPKRGLTATVVGRYVGRRYLDEQNIAPVGGYMQLDADVGYGFGRAQLWHVWLEGSNLTNQRPPVTSSEFGSQSFYLLPARTLWVRLTYAWQ